MEQRSIHDRHAYWRFLVGNTQMKRVYVRWVDSCSLAGEWMNREELDTTKGETMCETLGWLVEQNEHSYYVAGHLSPEQYGSLWQIPRAAVKQLEILEWKKIG